ncbi:hypothetical protein [Mucilaginibacter sp. JRF]|uniref:hypothetical protein n=1 Tax=Mucilaginibacter sp. JRF TaxID=2780088 RepID=UPI001D16F41D|nr:hypothetical protein [Mucilaginibacter sp. JRF]
MEVTCFEDRAFYAMIDKLEAYMTAKKLSNHKSTNGCQAKKPYACYALPQKPTLQKFRDEGKNTLQPT